MFCLIKRTTLNKEDCHPEVPCLAEGGSKGVWAKRLRLFCLAGRLSLARHFFGTQSFLNFFSNTLLASLA